MNMATCYQTVVNTFARVKFKFAYAKNLMTHKVSDSMFTHSEMIVVFHTV